MQQLIVPLLLDMARAARALSQPKFRTGLIAELKKDSSPVSAIDRAVEQRLREFVPLAEKTLGATVGFLGEEFDTLNPDAEFMFIVDPIDGTKPYLLGRSEWFMLIGVYQKGEGFVAGLCDQPDVDRAHYAVRGGGAWILDGKNLQPHGAARLPAVADRKISDSILMTFDPYMLPPQNRALYDTLYKQVMYTVPGGDAGNYARVAEGNGQIVLECVGGVYDIAALWPLITETGGRMIGLNEDNTTFVPGLDFGSRRTVLTTCSAAMQDEILALI